MEKIKVATDHMMHEQHAIAISYTIPVLMVRSVSKGSLTNMLSQTEADIETWYISLSWRVTLKQGEVVISF